MSRWRHRLLLATTLVLATGVASLADEELGRFSANPFDPQSTGNPDGAGSVHKVNGINNPASPYGSVHSDRSANDPTATDAPRLYDDNGNYRGRLSSNPHHPDSVSNPNGRFGSRYSPDSVNNPDGLGNPLRADSPANPHGRGLRIVGTSDDEQDRADDASSATPGPAGTNADAPLAPPPAANDRPAQPAPR